MDLSDDISCIGATRAGRKVVQRMYRTDLEPFVTMTPWPITSGSHCMKAWGVRLRGRTTDEMC